MLGRVKKKIREGRGVSRTASAVSRTGWFVSRTGSSVSRVDWGVSRVDSWTSSGGVRRTEDLGVAGSLGGGTAAAHRKPDIRLVA